MKNFIFFFLFLLPASFVHATDASQENTPLFQDIPLLKQNLRLFETISLHIISEERAERAEWTLVEEKTLRWDLKKQSLWRKSLKPKQMVRSVSVFHNNRQMTYVGDALSPLTQTDNPGSRIHTRGVIQVAPKNIFLASRLDFVWFFYDFHIPIGTSDMIPAPLLTDSEFLNSKIIKTDDPTVICIRIHELKRMLINRNTGMITKIIWGREENGKFTEGSSMEVTEFASVSGWYFPISILTKSSEGERRQRIDVKSLKINEPLPASDFVVTIPSGTQILDHIKGATYVTGRPITSADISDIETQLRSLVKKAQDNTKTKNTDGKTPQKP